MHSVRRHVELQKEKRRAQENGAELLVRTVMAVTTGRWNVDGARDPGMICERLQRALLEQDMTQVVSHTGELAEVITFAVRAGEFTPFTLEDHEMVSKAEVLFEAAIENSMTLGDFSI